MITTSIFADGASEGLCWDCNTEDNQLAEVLHERWLYVSQDQFSDCRKNILSVILKPPDRVFFFSPVFSAQLSCISCSKLASWWTRVFHQCFCNCSPAPFVAVKSWPAPPLRHSPVEALAVLDRLELHSPLRASHPVRRARKRTKRKTKMVSK